MRVLILEDDIDRQKAFPRRYPDALIVTTAPACIDRLVKTGVVIAVIYLVIKLLRNHSLSKQ